MFQHQSRLRLRCRLIFLITALSRFCCCEALVQFYLRLLYICGGRVRLDAVSGRAPWRRLLQRGLGHDNMVAATSTWLPRAWGWSSLRLS
jgi:hypothetical protein